MLKTEENKNDIFLNLCAALLSYIAGGLNVIEKASPEKKKKMILNELVDISSVCFVVFILFL